MSPIVSVIIPLYNKAPYIKRALDSVLSQSIQDFEIIVVNDGSRDGGELIVEEYIDSRINLLNQENQGVSVARNHGVSVAKADLITFLDADDEWLPQFLENVLGMAKKYPHAGAWGTEVIVERCGKVRKYHKINPIDSEEGLIPSYFKYTACNSHPLLVISSLISKQVYLDLGGFNENMTEHEDYDLFDRIAYHHEIAYSTLPLAIYHSDASEFTVRLNKLNRDVQHPFVDYYSNIPIYIQKMNKHYNDVSLYLESLNLLEADIKSYSNLKEAHQLLKTVRNPKLKRAKYVLFRDMHFRKLPKPIRMFLSNLWYFGIKK